MEKSVESLIDTFLYAGKISLELRKKGLIKKIKSDNTPVSNGDLEVNVLDVVVLINMILGTELENYSTADLNSDGQINVQDIILVVSVIIGE